MWNRLQIRYYAKDLRRVIDTTLKPIATKFYEPFISIQQEKTMFIRFYVTDARWTFSGEL